MDENAAPAGPGNLPIEAYDEYLDGDAHEILETRWPTVVGVISLVYAGLGLLCGVAGAAWLVFMDALFSAFDFDVVAPAAIKIVGVLGSVVGTSLALVMLTGAVFLVRRRRRGVATLKAWAILRMIWLVVSLGLSLWLMPANIAFQLDVQQAQVDQAKADGRPVPPHLLQTEDSLWTRTIIGTAISTAVVAIYPTFMIFYLSRRRIADEISRWP